MTVLDPGHAYQLDPLDGQCDQVLTFVKREGDGYPGNVGHHPGTTTQEVLRALVDRTRYVQGQIPCPENTLIESHLLSALYLLENRAAKRHGRVLEAGLDELRTGDGKCPHCGHVGCTSQHDNGRDA